MKSKKTKTPKLRIRKGDLVQVVAGSDKGVQGKVVRVNPDKMQVVVEGVNLRIRHTRPTQEQPNGARIEREQAIHYSNVMLVADGKPTRLGIKEDKTTNAQGKEKTVRTRIARANGQEL